MNFLFDDSYIKSTEDILNESVFNDKFSLKSISKEVKNKNKNIASMLKKAVFEIYKESPETLASNLPSVFEIIRLTIIVGIPMAINPLLGIVTLIVDRVIKDKVDAKVIDKYISKYEKEIDKTRRKIDNCKNKQQKKELEDFLNVLEKGLSNLEDRKWKLEDEDTVVLNKMKEIGDKELDEAVNILVKEYYMLTEDQRIILFDEDFILSEGVIDTVKNETKVLKHGTDKKIASMDRWFQSTARTIKHGIQNKSRTELIENESFPKMSKMIKRAIILGTTWAINPAVAIIGAMTAFVLSKRGTEKQRKKLIAELNNELELINEKIKDADSNNDKKQKYELIRLRQKVQMNRDKIKRYI